VFRYQDGQYGYEVRQMTTVEVGSGATPLVADTVQTMAALTYTVSTTAGTPIVSVTVDSLVISSARDSTAPPQRLGAPVTVQFPITYVPPTTATDSAALLTTCDSMDEAARVLAADGYLQIPIPLERSRGWSDSSSVVLCRGGIPLQATRVSHFQISDIRQSRDTTIAVISRQTALTLRGTGSQGTRRITVQGQGTSETVFTYSVNTGRFLGNTGQSVLQLVFETVQQTEQVVQRSSSTVQLRAVPPGS
jgi:hypothetical protein